MNSRLYFPAAPGMVREPDLDVTLQITVPSGRMDLDIYPYQLADDALNEQHITWRKQEATSPFMAGSYLVSAVQENITVPVAVWVRADSHDLLEDYTNQLVDAFSQFSYQLWFAMPDWLNYEVWTCQPAEITVSTLREYRHATMAKVTATVPRLPTAALVER